MTENSYKSPRRTRRPTPKHQKSGNGNEKLPKIRALTRKLPESRVITTGQSTIISASRKVRRVASTAEPSPPPPLRHSSSPARPSRRPICPAILSGCSRRPRREILPAAGPTPTVPAHPAPAFYSSSNNNRHPPPPLRPRLFPRLAWGA